MIPTRLSYLAISQLLVILLLLLATSTMIPYIVKTYAHFVGGETKTIGNYNVQFLFSPSKPVVGDNSTKLNFSILDKDQNEDIKSIFVALTIKEKNSRETVHQTVLSPCKGGTIGPTFTLG